ncbi:hypothetical protein L1049_018515 [Liquidambar formosana]|uniref:Uncharacterized protein n=1 Tax=Liquidambar formosana TaxID=63359 RepID=A0AAP0RA72_LIQFO
MGRRILNDALRTIVNAEKRGKAIAQLKPVSTVMASFLNIMKHRGYIKDFQIHDPHRVGKITVELQGRINDCRALTYRQDIKAKEIEEYRLRKLPTSQFHLHQEYNGSFPLHNIMKSTNCVRVSRALTVHTWHFHGCQRDWIPVATDISSSC